MADPVCKVAICGNAGSGKTTWLKRVTGYEFDPKYIATLGVNVMPYRVETNYGWYTINFWDMAGDPKFGGLREGYMVQSDACIIALDGSNTSPDCNDYWKWYDMFRSVNQSTPVIPIQTKCEMSQEPTTVAKVSSKNGSYIHRPVVLALRQITGYTNLYIK
jgi:GTP-binding nuclear protein Ran